MTQTSRLDAVTSPVERLAYRLNDLAGRGGISPDWERERSAGRVPRPDLHIGRCPLWRPETISDG